MNKELINKYKPEFDYWLNGGKILYKHTNSNAWWNEEPWSYSLSYVTAIIINDEYAEFRKALVEGKTIQLNGTAVNGGYGETWNDCNKENLFIYGITAYRIKPDEPKFKVGDFVTPLNREINCSVWQIDKVLSCNTVVASSIMLDPRTIQLWAPVKNEWCWFYDNPKEDKCCNLSQFGGESNERCFKTNCGIPWNFCEPFLNSRPSHLKDK